MTLTYQTAGEWQKYGSDYARERREPVAEYKGKNVVWWLIITVDEYGDISEELDIEATSKKAARAFANQWLKDGYEPGLKIKECILA